MTQGSFIVYRCREYRLVCYGIEDLKAGLTIASFCNVCDRKMTSTSYSRQQIQCFQLKELLDKVAHDAQSNAREALAHECQSH